MKKTIMKIVGVLGVVSGCISYIFAAPDPGAITWNPLQKPNLCCYNYNGNNIPKIAASSDLSKILFFYNNVNVPFPVSCLYCTFDNSFNLVSSGIAPGVDNNVSSVSTACSQDLSQIYTDYVLSGSNAQRIYSWFPVGGNLSCSPNNLGPSELYPYLDISLLWINDPANNNNYLLHIFRCSNWSAWNQNYNVGQVQQGGSVNWAPGQPIFQDANGNDTFIDSSGFVSSNLLQDGKYSLLNIGMDRSGGQNQSILFAQPVGFSTATDGSLGSISNVNPFQIKDYIGNPILVDYSCFSRSDYLDFDNCYRVVLLYKKQNDSSRLYYQVGNETPYGDIIWAGENILPMPSDSGTQLNLDYDGNDSTRLYGDHVSISKDGQHIVFFATYTNNSWDTSVNPDRVYSLTATVNSDNTLIFSNSSKPQFTGHKGFGYNIALSNDGTKVFMGMCCAGDTNLYFMTGNVSYPARQF